MSSFVLLDSNGAVARRLQFVSLPDSYVIPDGMTLSWRTQLTKSSRDPIAYLVGAPLEPFEAAFYFGSAWGQVSRSEVISEITNPEGRLYRVRGLGVIVQGTSVADVMSLRDHIMHLINAGIAWGTVNDLNPKPKPPGLLQRLRTMLGWA